MCTLGEFIDDIRVEGDVAGTTTDNLLNWTLSDELSGIVNSSGFCIIVLMISGPDIAVESGPSVVYLLARNLHNRSSAENYG